MLFHFRDKSGAGTETQGSLWNSVMLKGVGNEMRRGLFAYEDRCCQRVIWSEFNVPTVNTPHRMLSTDRDKMWVMKNLPKLFKHLMHSANNGKVALSAEFFNNNCFIYLSLFALFFFGIQTTTKGEENMYLYQRQKLCERDKTGCCGAKSISNYPICLWRIVT